jgi:hypothetical protein
MTQTAQPTLKRGTRVAYSYAGGKVVSGIVVKQHKAEMADWFVLRLTDEAGTYCGSCHREQITVTDNRAMRP